MHEDAAPDPSSDEARTEPVHPLQRAHQFFQKAAPVVREVKAELDRQGGIERAGEAVVERINEVARRAEEAVAKATAIEGEVIVREPEAAATAPGTPGPTSGTTMPTIERQHLARWIALALVVAAAVFGALRLQRR